MREANTLDIGPMGFSGKFTIGCCKIDKLNRLPASFFVSVAYMCWAYRRRGVVLDVNGSVVEWLYQAPHEFQHQEELPDLTLPAADVVRLSTPLSEADIRKLKIGDVVLLDGIVFTGRDAVHKYLHDGGDLDVIRHGVIYHCGPVVLKENGQYRVLAAGPTTSIREEPYQADIIKRFGLKAVIGKGGHGSKDAEGLSGKRLRLSSCDWRRGSNLCTVRSTRVERVSGTVRQSGSRLGASG